MKFDECPTNDFVSIHIAESESEGMAESSQLTRLYISPTGDDQRTDLQLLQSRRHGRR